MFPVFVGEALLRGKLTSGAWHLHEARDIGPLTRDDNAVAPYRLSRAYSTPWLAR